MALTPAWKRYNMRVVWLSLLYCVFLLPAVYGFKHRLVPHSVVYLVAILPALPIIGIFAAIGRYLVEEQDEYVRMLMVRQILWASGLTTVYGCAFDRQGNFWATEMFEPNPAGAPGDVVRIPFANPSSITHIGLGSLPTPGGIALGPDSAMYVAVGAPDATPASGGVIKVSAS